MPRQHGNGDSCAACFPFLHPRCARKRRIRLGAERPVNTAVLLHIANLSDGRHRLPVNPRFGVI